MLACLAATALAGAASIAHAQAEEPFVDITYTIVDLESVSVGPRPADRAQEWRYRPRLKLRLFGVNDGDAVRVRWKQAGRVLADIRCPLSVQDGDGRVDIQDRCWRAREANLDATGPVEAEIVYVDDTRETERAIDTLRLEVARYWHADRLGASPIHSVRYQVLQDDLLGLGWLWHRDPVQRQPRGDLYFYFWAATAEDASYSTDASFRCERDGQPVPEMRRNGSIHESIGSVVARDRRATADGVEERTLAYHMIWVKPDLVWGPRNPATSSTVHSDRYNVSEHPGSYVCRFRLAGTTVRSFPFVVRPDGTFAPHPVQQGSQGLTLRPGAVFVELGFPRDNALEHTFAPERIRQRGAYGHAWPPVPSIRTWLSSLPDGFGRSTVEPPGSSAAGRRGRRR
ncbi:MAG: hypothetical protein ACFCGT_28240 [Sandaracinaceae bacterium]